MIRPLLSALAVVVGLLGVQRAMVRIAGRRARRRFGADLTPPGGAAALLRTRCAHPPAVVSRALIEAGYDDGHDRLWGLWLAGAPVAAVIGLVSAPALAPVFLVTTALGPIVVLRLQRGRGDRLVERDLPTALEAVARSLRSGSSVVQAVGDVADRAVEPLAAELHHMVGQVGQGLPLADAIGAWVQRRPSPPVRLAGTALTMAGELGGSGARAVDRVARSLRERHGVRRELQALSSQARLSALVIVLAPAAFCVAGLAVDGTPAHFLLSSPTGWGCLGGGAALDVLGAIWMSRIVRGVAT